MPECQVCGKPFSVITNTHLKRHGLTCEQYRAMFPDAEFASDDVKQRISKNSKDRHAAGEFNYDLKRGWFSRLPKEHQDRLSKKRSSVLKKKWADCYEEMSEAVGNGLREAWDSGRLEYLRESIGAQSRERWKDEDFRSMQSELLHAAWQDMDLRRRQIRKRKANGAFDKITDIEKTLYGILDGLDVSYSKQVIIDHYIVDALVENWLILEAYGNYWHSYPDRIERDSKRKTDLESLGFQVLPIWGNDLRESPGMCADRITYVMDCT